jgi:hypothetical protein
MARMPNADCVPGPAGEIGGQSRTSWVLLYPDCTDADGRTIGWAVVDAERGFPAGFAMDVPCYEHA